MQPNSHLLAFIAWSCVRGLFTVFPVPRYTDYKGMFFTSLQAPPLHGEFLEFHSTTLQASPILLLKGSVPTDMQREAHRGTRGFSKACLAQMLFFCSCAHEQMHVCKHKSGNPSRTSITQTEVCLPQGCGFWNPSKPEPQSPQSNNRSHVLTPEPKPRASNSERQAS